MPLNLIINHGRNMHFRQMHSCLSKQANKHFHVQYNRDYVFVLLLALARAEEQYAFLMYLLINIRPHTSYCVIKSGYAC